MSARGWDLPPLLTANPRYIRCSRSVHFWRSPSCVHPLQRGEFFADVQVHVFFLWFEDSEPLTRVDTEHRFVRNLKAILARFCKIFLAGRFAGIVEKRGATSEAKNTGGEDAGEFAKPFVGSQGSGVIVWSHGTSGGSPHSDLRWAAGRLRGRKSSSIYNLCSSSSN
jgi:hypothetical protein